MCSAKKLLTAVPCDLRLRRASVKHTANMPISTVDLGAGTSSNFGIEINRFKINRSVSVLMRRFGAEHRLINVSIARTLR